MLFLGVEVIDPYKRPKMGKVVGELPIPRMTTFLLHLIIKE